MKRYFSLILAIAATVSAQIVPSTGNVRGPTSATDNAVARYDGTTGKLIQNSGVTIDDSGNLTVSGTGNNVFRGPIRWGNTSWPGYNGYISEASTDTALNPAIARNLIGSTGSNYTIADGQLGSYSGFELGTDIRWFAASGTFTTGQSLVPTERMRLTYLGNFLIGTTSDSSDKLQVNGSILASPSGAGYLVFTRHGSQNTGLYYNGSQGLLLYTNTSIAMTLSSAQALRLNGYGAGTLTTDSSGNVTATSDERAKNITGTFTKGLAEVVKLTPKRYTWKPETGLNTTDEVASLTAQDLIAAGIPEAVSTYRTVADLNDDGTPKLDADGKPLTKRIDATYTVSDRAVIAALVNAVKELKAEVDALKAARN